MSVPQLVDHLFRREAGRMVSTLTRVFGPENLTLAEDVVQEALIQALRTWPFRGVPDNPGGWLLQVAKNRALDALRREANLKRKGEEIRTWAASSGEDLVRRDVCAEAVRLARLVAGHPATDAPKAHALAALLLLQAARNPARVDPEGNLLLLSEQDRGLWDRRMIAAGFHHLDRAASGTELSPYHLEAGIAACHASAPSPDETDWPYILSLYDALLAVKPSPVVALNRAVALAMVQGPDAGLAALAEIRDHPAFADYYPLPVAEGELHARAGRTDEAARYFERALGRVCPEPVRRRLQERLRQLREARSPRAGGRG